MPIRSQLDLRRRMAPDNARAMRTGDFARPPNRISLPSINSESDSGGARDGSGCSFESECAPSLREREAYGHNAS